jgi:hypothetical protein
MRGGFPSLILSRIRPFVQSYEKVISTRFLSKYKHLDFQWNCHLSGLCQTLQKVGLSHSERQVIQVIFVSVVRGYGETQSLSFSVKLGPESLLLSLLQSQALRFIFIFMRGEQ